MSAKQTADEIRLDGKGLRFGEVMDVARFGAKVALTGAAVERMEESARIVERLGNSDEPVYGVSTGFGSLATTSIPADRREQLQLSLIRSHAAGMGEPVEAEVVRGLMLMRARSLAMARSGARPVVAETLLALLNSGLSPVVPEYGSLGASGDLAPLAHCALVLIGEGEVLGPGGSRIPSGEALRSA
ncbi:MAG TPA: aromatic amino acid lyase, partial [Solirubrobacterales bacterium]|nr:aromatic amino acid lyase [Solirubrobacterales bacterium]